MQAGSGIMMLLVLVLISGRSLVASHATRLLILAAFNIPPILFYYTHDMIKWNMTLILSAGSIGGAIAGNYISQRVSAKALHTLLIAIVIISIFYLLEFI